MPRMTRSPLRRGALAGTLVVLVAVVALSACSGDSDGSSNRGGAERQGPEVADVVELGGLLDAAGIPCALEYEGLVDDRREVSICQIDGGQATLTVWDDPAELDLFMVEPMSGPGATTVGPNWTIDVASEATAERLAGALGADVRLPDGSR
jgi:hypothetical protein